MTIDKIIKRFQSWNDAPISDPELALEAGFTLRYLGTGAYRRAYHLVGTNLIAKFPYNGAFAIEHAKQEYKTVTTILTSDNSKYSSIKKHLPKLYYCDTATGITVAQKYRLLPRKSDSVRAMLQVKMLKVLDGCIDVENSGNVGVDGRGTLKLIDGGFLKP